MTAALAAAPAVGQQPRAGELVEIVARIEAVEGEFLAIDRGSADGVDLGREGRIESLHVDGKRESSTIGEGRVVEAAERSARLRFKGTDVRPGDLVAIKARVPRARRSVLWDIARHHIELTDIARKTVHTDFRTLRPGDDEGRLERVVAAALADVQVLLARPRPLGKFVRGVREQGHLTKDGRWTSGRFAGKTPVETLQGFQAADARAFLDYVASFPAKYQGYRYRLLESLAAWIASGAPPSTDELLAALEGASDEEAAGTVGRFRSGILVERIVTRWRLQADEAVRAGNDGRSALRRLDAAERMARILLSLPDVEPRWKAWFAKELRRQRVSRGRALRILGRHDEARKILREALEDLRSEPRLRAAEADALAELGEVGLARGKPLEARRWFTQAAAVDDDTAAQPRIQLGVGEAELALGRLPAARVAFERAGELAREVPDSRLEARARLALARVLIRLQKQEEAHGIFDAVYRDRMAAGDLAGAARAAEEQARVYALYGKAAEADRAMARAILAYPQPVDKARVLREAAGFYLALGRRDLHDNALGNAIRLLERHADRAALGDALRERADAFRDAGDQAKAKADYEAARAHYRAAGDRRGEGEAEYGLARSAHATGAWDEANTALERAATLLDGQPRRQAEVLRLLGSTRLRAGDAPAAVAAYSRALEASRAAGAGVLECDVLLDRAGARGGDHVREAADLGQAFAVASRLADLARIATCHFRLGQLWHRRFRWEAAERELSQAYRLFDQAEERHDQIRVLLELADVMIGRGRFAKAQEWYEAARKDASARKYVVLEGFALRGLAVARRHLGQLQGAREAIEAAIRIEDPAQAWMVARNRHEFGLVLSASGDLMRAREKLERALDLYVGANDRWSEVAMLNNLALNRRRLGRNEQALEGFRRARERARGIDDGHLHGVLALNFGQTLLNLSRTRPTLPQRLAELETALEEADEGLRRLQRVRMPSQLAEMWQVRARILSAWAEALRDQAATADPQREGALLREAARLAGASMASFDAAAQYFRRGQMKVRLANTRMRQARELVRLQRPAEALQAADEALAAVRGTGASEVEWETRFARSLALEGLPGRLGEARTEREAAIAIVEKQVSAARSPADRRALLQSKVELYDAMADLLLRLGREAGNARTARELEARARRMMQRVSDEYRRHARRKTMRGESEEIREAEARLAAAEEGLGTATDDASRKVVAVEYEKAAALLLQAYENDAGLRERSAVDIRDLDRFLPKNTLLLHYFPGEDVLTIWLARRKRGEDDRSNTLLFSVPVRRERINALVRACRDSLLDFGYALQDGLDPDPAAAGRLDARLAELYDLLVPAEPKVIREEFEAAKRVVVIPHGDLYVLPFEALRGPHGYLGKDKAFVYFIDQSHVSTRLPQTRGRRSGTDRWAAFANPRGDLEDARREVDAITAWWKRDPKVYAGPAATRDAVLEAIRKDFTILHFATHGRLKSDVSETSIELHDVQLTRRDVEQLMRDEKYMDGFADVRLVVISACNSAVGQRAPVEHVFGFPDSLQRAGVAGIVGSLWPVESESASLFMQLFYRHLLSEKGGGVAESLRAAREQLMEHDGGKYVHPYYWAPFLLYGDWR